MSSPSSFPRDRSGPRLFASPRPEATGEEKADEEALGPGSRIGLVQTFDALARLEKEEIRVTLSLNINSALLLHPDLARWIAAEWQRTGIPNNRLIFGISRDRTGHPRSIASVISSFRRSGVRFALKDWGLPWRSRTSGRPSLGFVKISPEITGGFRLAPTCALSQLRPLRRAGGELGRTVVLKGVEEEALLEVALLAGFRFAQGYALSRLLPEDTAGTRPLLTPPVAL